ncbi:MAG TPA: hypothetical protein VGR91_13680 [Stellaceae bacterium]|nr:hypothetical protein [Stellaceae bacterium]
MAFWKKRIELPGTFYQAVGDCLLNFMESQSKSRKIQTSSMSINNACELLDMVKEGFAKLSGLISNFPIKSGSLIALSDVEEDIRTCEKRKTALLEITDLAPSESLSSCNREIDGYDPLQFQRSIINMQTLFGLQFQKATEMMAKAANTSHSDFMTIAVRAAAATPRGQNVYAEAVHSQRN